MKGFDVDFLPKGTRFRPTFWLRVHVFDAFWGPKKSLPLLPPPAPPGPPAPLGPLDSLAPPGPLDSLASSGVCSRVVVGPSVLTQKLRAVGFKRLKWPS